MVLDMLQTILKAASNFCREQLGAEKIEVYETKQLENGALVAYIDIETRQNGKYRVYLAAKKEFIQFVAHVFLEEDESDEETIMDMAQECTNLIVGSAKVIASKNGVDFTISTPHLEMVETFTYKFDESALLECNGKTLFIALSKMN